MKRNFCADFLKLLFLAIIPFSGMAMEPAEAHKNETRLGYGHIIDRSYIEKEFTKAGGKGLFFRLDPMAVFESLAIGDFKKAKFKITFKSPLLLAHLIHFQYDAQEFHLQIDKQTSEHTHYQLIKSDSTSGLGTLKLDAQNLRAQSLISDSTEKFARRYPEHDNNLFAYQTAYSADGDLTISLVEYIPSSKVYVHSAFLHSEFPFVSYPSKHRIWASDQSMIEAGIKKNGAHAVKILPYAHVKELPIGHFEKVVFGLLIDPELAFVYSYGFHITESQDCTFFIMPRLGPKNECRGGNFDFSHSSSGKFNARTLSPACLAESITETSGARFFPEYQENLYSYRFHIREDGLLEIKGHLL